MRQGGRRTSRRSANDNIKYIRMAAIPLIIVFVLVIIILVMDRKPGSGEADPSAQGISTEAEAAVSQESLESGESVEPDNNQYTTDFSEYELQKDAIPQVNLLISDYFQAKVDQDAEKLYALFGKSEEDESLEVRREQLRNEAVYIEDYVDIVCYTKPGLTENSYVVYVAFNVKFKRVDTLAPGLLGCYVVMDESGNYIIREHIVGEEADYMAKQNQSEDVRLLSNQVNERLKEAIYSDTLLAGIYKDLRDGAVVSESEEEEDGADSHISLEEKSPAPAESSPQNQSGDSAEESGAGESSGPQTTSETPSGSGEDSKITIQ